MFAVSVETPKNLAQDLVEFLKKDLVHLFDEQGIDKSMYEQKVEFRDPLTNYDTLDGYLFNISMLRFLFSPLFELHTVRQVGFLVSLATLLGLAPLLELRSFNL